MVVSGPGPSQSRISSLVEDSLGSGGSKQVSGGTMIVLVFGGEQAIPKLVDSVVSSNSFFRLAVCFNFIIFP